MLLLLIRVSGGNQGGTWWLGCRVTAHTAFWWEKKYSRCVLLSGVRGGGQGQCFDTQVVCEAFG